jgi:hypothetical protein
MPINKAPRITLFLLVTIVPFVIQIGKHMCASRSIACDHDFMNCPLGTVATTAPIDCAQSLLRTHFAVSLLQ